MGLFGGIMKAARGITHTGLNVVRAAAKTPLVKAVPLLGTVATGVSIGSSIFSGGSGGMPPLPGAGVNTGFVPPSTMGKRGIFANDPNLPKMLEQWAISKGNLRQYFRAPKGFVVLKDEVGDPYGLPKFLARQLGLWKPSPKPFFTASEMRALQVSNRVVNKFKTMEKRIKSVANFRAPRPKALPAPSKGRK